MTPIFNISPEAASLMNENDAVLLPFYKKAFDRQSLEIAELKRKLAKYENGITDEHTLDVVSQKAAKDLGF